ncbi:MAG: hypothetical protein KDA31_09275 [Phycisphaerales bacterium]|nr:hypothetical protein [Phycisphaerales bacterium]
MSVRSVLALSLMCFTLVGCETYEEEAPVNPFFAGMEGVSGPGATKDRKARIADPRYLPAEAQREVDDDGNVTLRAKGPRHLMRHIFETLRNNERELFIDQVLSNATKQEFIDHGKDPNEAFDMLLEDFEMINQLFARMPMAENAPNARFETIGTNMHRMRLIKGVGKDLKWQGFDMITEDGYEKLLWFYEER